MLEYLVLDLETGSQTVFNRKGNPFFNKICAIGYAKNGKVTSEYYTDPGFDNIPHNLSGVNLIVGHNIKFDLLYLWKITKFQDWLKSGGKIWCTQLAHYMLSGQQDKYNALRDIAVNQYGCKERPKVMEEYWEKGVDTFDIPQEHVIYDVENDVLDTEQIYLQQVKKAKELGMLQLITDHMEGLLASTEIEFNGLYINKQIFDTNKKQLEEELEQAKTELNLIVDKYWRFD